MSILGRLSNLIKSNLNSAVDKLSDPAKEVDLLRTEKQSLLHSLTEGIAIVGIWGVVLYMGGLVNP